MFSFTSPLHTHNSAVWYVIKTQDFCAKIDFFAVLTLVGTSLSENDEVQIFSPLPHIWQGDTPLKNRLCTYPRHKNTILNHCKVCCMGN